MKFSQSLRTMSIAEIPPDIHSKLDDIGKSYYSKFKERIQEPLSEFLKTTGIPLKFVVDWYSCADCKFVIFS